jgi:hypothetical protein
MARPTNYSIELGANICERLADGESLKSICAAEDMPSKSVVYLWLTKQTDFLDMYVRAREDQADTMADEIVDISDDKTEDANSRRVRIDARKWVAAKLKPKKYGDKIETTMQGPGGGPVENKWTVEFVNPTSKE